MRHTVDELQLRRLHELEERRLELELHDAGTSSAASSFSSFSFSSAWSQPGPICARLPCQRRSLTGLRTCPPAVPGSRLSPWGVVRSWPHITAVMQDRCQGCTYALLLVSPPRAQAAFPPPPSGTARVAISRGDRPPGFGVKGHHKRKGMLALKHLVCSCFRREPSERMFTSTNSEQEIVQDPSSTHRCECSRAPKTGAQLRDNLEEHKKMAQKGRKTLNHRHNHHC